jgi:chaperonin GroEL (HSP60 family)
MIYSEITEGNLNIVPKETTKKLILDTLRDMRTAVEHTLGPAGKTTLLHDPSGVTSLYPTKDGFRLIMSLAYDSYFSDAILKVLRDVSVSNNMSVGDATTSCVVIIDEFYKLLTYYIDGGIDDNPNDTVLRHMSATGISNTLTYISEVLADFLYKYNYIVKLDKLSVKKRLDIITKVSTIAANNDYTTGKFVADIFKPVLDTLDELFVDIGVNNNNDTTIASDIGFELPCGHINRVMSTERDGKTAIYENPKFLLVEGPLLDGDIDTFAHIINLICNINQQPLAIIADDYSNKFSQFLYNLRMGFTTKQDDGKEYTVEPQQILAIMHSTANDLGHERMVDLECALGGHILVCHSTRIENLPTKAEEVYSLLGSAKKIVSIPHTCRVFNGNGDPTRIKGRVEEIEELINKMVMADSDRVVGDIALYRERIGMLKSNMVAIKVGDISYRQKQFKTLVLEDCVYSIKSTIKNGYTLAGQVSLQHLIKTKREEIVQEVLKRLRKEQKNIIFGKNKEDNENEAVNRLLDIIRDSFSSAYIKAIQNAIPVTTESGKILTEIYQDDLKVFNLITGEYETMDNHPNLISAGNTDIEMLKSVISVTNLFLNAETLSTLYIPKVKTDK